MLQITNFRVYMKLYYGVIKLTNKEIILNVWNENNKIVTAVQGEIDSRFLIITLQDDNGPINLTGKSVKFLANKPDGTVVFNNMDIKDAENGVVVLGLTSQMSAIPGLLSGCEIHIISENGKTLIAKKINILVQNSLGPAIEESVSEISAYQEMIMKVNQLEEHTADKSNPHKVTAIQVGALPDTTRYGISLSIDETSLNLKDQNGTILSSVTTPKSPTYSNATSSQDGLMSSTDKSKLDKIENGAEMNIQSDWNQTNTNSDDYIKNKPTIPTSLINLTGVLPIEQGGTGATTARNAITNLGGIPIYTVVTDFISLPATTSEIIQAMPSSAILMTWVDTTSDSITDLPCNYGILTIHKRSSGRIQILYNRSYEGAINGNNFYFGNYNTLSKTVTWNRIFTNYSGCQVPIENGGTGASTSAAALIALGAQASQDNSLLTNSKTIVGAINELYNMIN